MREGLTSGNVCISDQGVQECLNVALRKAEVALPPEAARSYPDAVLLPLMQVSASEPLHHRVLDVQARWRCGFCDSLIVAAVLAAGCRTLLGGDLRHGQPLEGLAIVDPFR